MNKTVITIIGIIIIIILAFVIFGGRAEAPEEEIESEVDREVITENGTYSVDASASDVRWEAGKTLILNYTDRGMIDLKAGEIVVEDGEVVSGNLVFDMTTINATETSNTENTVDRLTNHLKSDDFFAVETYPEATFEVTGVEMVGGIDYNLTGDLTIRDKTESITFPAEIYADGENVVVEADITVDRTLFDVRFGSGTFFENLGDNIIDDEFILDAHVVASPEVTAETTE